MTPTPDPEKPTTTKTTTRSSNVFVRTGKRFAATKIGGVLLMRVETRLIGLLLAGAVVFAGGAWIWQRQEDNARDQRASDAIEALEREYEVAHTLYDRQVEEHATCLDAADTRVDTREKLRGQFIAIAVNGANRSIAQAEGLRTAVLAILPDSTEAQAAMDNYVQLATDAANHSIDLAHDSQDIDYPSLDLAVERAKCVPPGPEPVDPTP